MKRVADWTGPSRAGLALAMLVSVGLCCGVAAGQDGSPQAPDGATPAAPATTNDIAIPVDSIELVYRRGDHPQHPPIDALLRATVTLTPTPEGYTAPVEGWPQVEIPIGDLTAGGEVMLFGAAIARISEALRDALTERYDLLGILVFPDREQVDVAEGDGAAPFVDLRQGDRSLRFVIHTAVVKNVVSIASGDRIADEDRIDSRAHLRIRERSPIQPWSGDPEPGAEQAADVDSSLSLEPRNDLLREDILEDYALRLGRHPGRRVDVAIAPSEGYFAAELQYLVRENKPWLGYYQLSNTGTEETDEWRHRFGFQHNQLFGLDDTLSLEYITAGFDESHSVTLSYSQPLFGNERIRWTVSGGWNQFDASTVGVQNEQFTGESWFWNAEIAFNVYQHRRFFVDLIAGVRYNWIQVTNEGLVDGTGEDAIFLPRAGLRFERFGETWNFTAATIFEWTENDISGASFDQLQRLGRLNPSEEWLTFQWDAELNFLLEPLLVGDAWFDPTADVAHTRAHEMAFTFSGQYAFNNRLIPNAERVVGGLFTVRGYPESITAGDTAYVGSVEYRFHLPRAFAPNPDQSGELFGRPFRAVPQRVFGDPDWDLILKAFFDYGKVYSHQQLAIESDETLASVGLGAEVQLYQNLSFRTDWGVVLDEVRTGTPDVVTEGSQRWHFVLTLLF